MQNPTGLVLFFVLAVVLAASYVGIRRRWASVAAIAAVCVVASFILMMLISLTQGNSIYQAVFVGLAVGGLFSGGILGMAWYFQNGELKKAAPAAMPPMDAEELPAEFPEV